MREIEIEEEWFLEKMWYGVLVYDLTDDNCAVEQLYAQMMGWA